MINPLEAKIAAPYARALYDYSNSQNVTHQVTGDFQNLDVFLKKAENLVDYLNNPIISVEEKTEILNKTLKSQLNDATFKFLLILVNRNRINILQSVIESYLEVVYNVASIKMIEISSAFKFTNRQKNTLVKKLKKLTNAREIRLTLTIDPTLIGGFLIKTDSRVIDLSIKGQLQQLAKHLDTVLDI
ncbi:ATP synthase F1 subunit delta [Gloeomargaritaceae cyanobacterium AH-226-B11]|jgi:F-type H+-transporting ATPase subunit delta|nr:ATP synthase F1 subunit delta [Gloeomargaritaceae cyanobacterium AH-226-B11]